MSRRHQPVRAHGYYWIHNFRYDSVIVMLFDHRGWHHCGHPMDDQEFEVVSGPIPAPTPEQIAGQVEHFAEQCRVQAALYGGTAEQQIWNDGIQGAYFVRRQGRTEIEIALSYEGDWMSISDDKAEQWHTVDTGEPNPEILFGPLVEPEECHWYEYDINRTYRILGVLPPSPEDDEDAALQRVADAIDAWDGEDVTKLVPLMSRYDAIQAWIRYYYEDDIDADSHDDVVWHALNRAGERADIAWPAPWDTEACGFAYVCDRKGQFLAVKELPSDPWASRRRKAGVNCRFGDPILPDGSGTAATMQCTGSPTADRMPDNSLPHGDKPDPDRALRDNPSNTPERIAHGDAVPDYMRFLATNCGRGISIRTADTVTEKDREASQRPSTPATAPEPARFVKRS